MALVLGTIMGQFIMPRPFIYKGLVQQPDAKQAFECPVDCDFIESLTARETGNLILAERPAGLHQDSHDIDPAARTVKLRGLQHFAGFSFQI